MRGKTIVITGATSGIGEVAAIRLAEQGARIVFTARDQDRADATMAETAPGQWRGAIMPCIWPICRCWPT